MSIKSNQEINEILLRLHESMMDFIEPGQTSYTENDVSSCMSIMNTFIDKAIETTSKDEFMKIVENSVLALNELNESTECELIETGQREDIAEIMIMIGFIKQYNSMEDDVTEEWRDW